MTSMVFVLDDDANVRDSLLSLLGAEGLNARAFTKGQDFFDAERPDVPSCLICDMKMPGLGGLEVAYELTRRRVGMPIIFMTGFGTIPMTVQAMKAGAVEFLTKPVDPDVLVQAVHNALETDASNLHARREMDELNARYQLLTPREHEALQLVIGGLLNKQVADAMGVSEIMAKTHKRKVMEKMAARSVADLVRSAERLNIAIMRSR